ncbi:MULTISPECIES: alpha/beta fold hydrolase [Microbacterium]|uniref:Alpha/beta hydrolase n=1 Tax=Microbacterium wangchenii TaxID=2541726 RepID=A0ABX5SSI2_9MICO|nr:MULTISPECIES: alpha/beta hydrolase [Microbacterium]MCK6065693.1 alpha/beta hydrolase [Microbacterium sp. EYE_512]QBR89101.1 alpha/beta hydrolase [Microbacterium wangchenii]TXK20821.1 alpha/beta hydrolase [Microbacterium wangchenii]
MLDVITDHVDTSEGDRIVYDRLGEGPGVLFVQPAGQTRATDPITPATLRALAEGGRGAAAHDRVGRGDSPAASPITLARELAAIEAILDVVGPAIVVGWSSGGAIALAAAARNEAVRGVVLFELPFDGSGEAAGFLEGIRQRVRAGDAAAIVEYYMKDMPPQWLEQAKAGPGWASLLDMAPSFEADVEALAWLESAPLTELLAPIRVPVLALTADDAQPFMHDAAHAIASATGGAAERIAGRHHGWDPDAMAARLLRLTE